MGKSSQYTHYMKRIDVNDASTYDIESHFTGLRYMKAEGMNDIGKTKNIYTEAYADSDRLRVHIPSASINGYTNEATKITMHFLIIGDASLRQTTLKNFIDYLRLGIHRYWDDARNLEFDFIVTDEIKVSDERWHGNCPYIEITVPMQNLNGKTKVHTS